MNDRSRALAVAAIEVSILYAIFAGLSIYYGARFHNLGTVWDLWFGADIPRAIRWVDYPPYVERWHLHPLIVPVLKAYGVVLHALRIHPPHSRLVWFAAPIGLGVAAGMVAASRIVATSLGAVRTSSVVLCCLLLIGPVLTFAPVPETHALGGATLLLQAAIVLRWLSTPATESALKRRWATGALVTGLAAAGITVVNALPAAILAIPILRTWTRRTVILIALAGVVTLIGCAGYAYLVDTESARALRAVVEYEGNFFTRPTLDNARLSFAGLVLMQFGAAGTALSTWLNPFSGKVVTSIVATAPSPLHWAALVCWAASLAAWWWGGASVGQPALRLFVWLCLGALSSLVAFHTMYSSSETYMLSAHAWPYVVLPLIVTAISGWRNGRRVPAVLLGLALALSVVQSASGFRSLHHLPSQPGEAARPVGATAWRAGAG